MNWIIGRGDDYGFAILRDKAGPFSSRAAALDHLIVHLEADRRQLAAAVARAKRTRRRISTADQKPAAHVKPS